MEKVLTSEMSKLIVVLGAAGMGTYALMARMITVLKGSFKPYLVSTLVYLLVALLFFILIVLTLKVSLFKDPAVLFIFLQFYFLLLGSLHLYFMNKKLEWSSEDS